MVKRKISRSFAKARLYKKRRLNGRSVSRPLRPYKPIPRGVLGHSLTPFPKTRMVKLRYVKQITMDAGTGSTTSYGFRSNDLYDPDYSSGTTPPDQPYYFDQLMAMYQKFTVVGSKITVMPFGATTSGHYYVVGLYRDTDTTARPATLIECMEAPGTVWTGVGNAEQNPRKISLTYSAKKTHRGKPLSNPDLAGSASASPVNSDFYRIFAGCPNSSTDPGEITVNVVIHYTVVLHDRIDPPTS